MALPSTHFLENFIDTYYIRQINAFSQWLSRHSLESECIRIDLPRQERNIRKGPPGFIFCSPGAVSAAVKKNGDHDGDAWHPIFRSNEFEIWEYAGKYRNTTLPIRFGLTDIEKNFSLKYVRQTLGEYLKSGRRDAISCEPVPSRFNQIASVDVALWVNGELRGSRIVQDLPLMNAIRAAALRSCRDERFKPISIEELDVTTIEIAVLSDLRVPLLGREFRTNTIAPEKGYLLSVQGQKGWFLPAVLNCLTFADLDDFLMTLIEKKVGVSKNLLGKARVEIFEVDNFIESGPPHRKSVSLYGPILKRKIDPNNHAQIISGIATRGADFLCMAQENDGNIPPIIDPMARNNAQVDWIRLALTGWSLASWGKVSGHARYLEASRKVFSYVVKNVLEHPYLREGIRCLSLVYTFNLASVLGSDEQAAKIHEHIIEMIPRLTYEPIRNLQVACHLLGSAWKDAALLSKAQYFAYAVLAEYERKLQAGNHLELAEFPELISLLRSIGSTVGNNEMLAKSEAISRWYIRQQLPDGSFPSTIGSTFSYVRGTGKIFEVLCLEPEKNKASIERTIQWLLQMQYNEDNTYFVKEVTRREIIGGFRHDYVNQAAWIDGVAHVLLGAARLQNVQTRISYPHASL